MNKHRRAALLAAVVGILASSLAAAGDAVLVEAAHRECAHGIHSQPNGGPFAVFLFCDDALGSNIGIILTERGAGPGNVPLEKERNWSAWGTTNRFWQDTKWAADVVNFAWGRSQRYLYVATSGIYGDGGFFKIDLRERTYQRLLPKAGSSYSSQLADEFGTAIKDINTKTGTITVAISLRDPKEEQVASETLPFE